MNIQSKTCSLIISLIVVIFSSTGLVFAATETRSVDFDKYSPLYVLLTIGNHKGCQNLSSCPNGEFKGFISTDKGKLTLMKEFLINADELLDNETHETGLPSNRMDFEFSTQFYKGFIFKLYPDEGATLDDVLTLCVKMNDYNGDEIHIPFYSLSTDLLSGLDNPMPTEKSSEYARVNYIAKIKPLFLGVENDSTPEMMRNRLKIMEIMLNLERTTRNMLLAGKIGNITYLELQKIWSEIWQNNLIDSYDVALFMTRYNRLKRMHETGKTSLPRMIGGVKILTRRITHN